MRILACACILWVLQTVAFAADFQVADIFGDHMVLQADRSIPVWGTASPGTTIVVQVGDATRTTSATVNGTWRLELPKLAVSAEPLVLKASSGSTTHSFNDVLVGEVWYASGQSNMDWKMKACANKLPAMDALLKQATNPEIRYRSIKTKDQAKPQTQIGDGGKWTICSPASAANFSGVAFIFARRLHQELKVPIGIIETAWGGHPIEPFIPAAAFTGHPVLEKELALGQAGDLAGLREMVGGVYARNHSWLPGTIFNSRVAPVAPFPVRGAIWYQAESNCGKGEDPRFYSEKMKALVRGWRTAWQHPSMPVYFVQLPQYDSAGWVRMRDEQRRALAEANTGMAVTIDLALSGIHPPNKLDVGERLALWPLAKDYGRKLAYSGPLYHSHSIQGKAIVVRFTHAETGLRAGTKTDLQETVLLDRKDLNGFEICGSDGVWQPADAVIADSLVRCSHPKVAKPVAVRYAWAPTMPNDKTWNLYNGAGLPASPFTSSLELTPYAP